MRYAIALLASAIMVLLLVLPVAAATRIEAIKARGALTCGIVDRVRGFTDISPDGRVTGFEPDLCRAIAAAILGRDAEVEYVAAEDVDHFIHSGEPDVVARRLTVTLRRALQPELSFSPIVFYDGAALLVPIVMQKDAPSAFAGQTICVRDNSETDRALTSYFKTRHLTFEPLRAADLEDATTAFLSKKCAALAADLSELAPIRARWRDRFAILPEFLSKEPLALLTHAEDEQFSAVVHWTINALIAAEELGISQKDARELRDHPNPEARRLIGLEPGNGAALGLHETWAANAIATVGNYGEIYARNIGDESAIDLPRGHNALWRDGGLLYALPMR